MSVTFWKLLIFATLACAIAALLGVELDVTHPLIGSWSSRWQLALGAALVGYVVRDTGIPGKLTRTLHYWREKRMRRRANELADQLAPMLVGALIVPEVQESFARSYSRSRKRSRR